MQEVEAVCSRVIIINNGIIVADGGISEIKTGNLRRNQIVLAEFENEIPDDQIQSIQGVKTAKCLDRVWEIEAESGKDIRSSIFQFAVTNKQTLILLQEKQQNLENVFHQLTKN